jgi:hypothetical protein
MKDDFNVVFMKGKVIRMNMVDSRAEKVIVKKNTGIKQGSLQVTKRIKGIIVMTGPTEIVR